MSLSCHIFYLLILGFHVHLHASGKTGVVAGRVCLVGGDTAVFEAPVLCKVKRIKGRFKGERERERVLENGDYSHLKKKKKALEQLYRSTGLIFL